MRGRKIAYGRIAEAARCSAPEIVRQWLPAGKRVGHEWEVLNPRRNDNRPGSFRINLVTGRWGDFATNDRGGDLVSLAAFLFHLNQSEAATRVARMLAIDPHE